MNKREKCPTCGWCVECCKEGLICDHFPEPLEHINKMRKRHAKEIEVLQNKCTHEESKWMPYAWAPGHLGPDVKVCKTCGKILEKQKIEMYPPQVEVEGFELKAKDNESN